MNEIKTMTLEEIKTAADVAEEWPGAPLLNFGELPFKALAAWVALNPQQAASATENFDVESVKVMFEAWWRTADCPPRGEPDEAGGSYPEERLEPCERATCPYHDVTYDQSCCAGYRYHDDRRYLPDCKDYLPHADLTGKQKPEKEVTNV